MPKAGLPGWLAAPYSWVAFFAAAAVNALSMAIVVLVTLPPSMRSKATSWPLSSVMAMHIGTPISRALSAAPAISRRASEMSRRRMVSTGILLRCVGGMGANPYSAGRPAPTMAAIILQEQWRLAEKHLCRRVNPEPAAWPLIVR